MKKAEEDLLRQWGAKELIDLSLHRHNTSNLCLTFFKHPHIVQERILIADGAGTLAEALLADVLLLVLQFLKILLGEGIIISCFLL